MWPGTRIIGMLLISRPDSTGLAVSIAQYEKHHRQQLNFIITSMIYSHEYFAVESFITCVLYAEHPPSKRVHHFASKLY